MTVAELIGKLETCPQDVEVKLCGQAGTIFNDFTPLKYKGESTVYLVPIFRREAADSITTAIPQRA